MIRRSGTARQVRGDLEQQRADEVGEHGRRPRAALAAQVAARDLERRRRWPPRRLARGLDRRGLDVAREHRRPAELRGRDREHARCRSPSRPARRPARARRAARARAAWSACAPVPNAWPGLDHDVERAVARPAPTAGARAAPADVERPCASCASARPSRRAARSWRRRPARRRPPRARRRSVGQLARGAVEHVLDRRRRRRRAPRGPPGASSSSSASTSSACSRATRTASRITRAPARSAAHRPRSSAVAPRAARGRPERRGDGVGLARSARRTASSRVGRALDVPASRGQQRRA